MTKEQKEKFQQLASMLSPENLCCDGELSRTQVIKKQRAINKAWKALEKEVGRKVTEEEVYEW